MNVEVEIRFADGRLQRLALPPGKYVIGRDAGDIVLGDPGVSTRHAELDVTEGRVTLADLGSTNGSYDGTERLTKPHPMVVGQALRLGGVSMMVCAPGSPMVSPAALPQAPARPRRSSGRRWLGWLGASAVVLLLLALVAPRWLGWASSWGSPSTARVGLELAGFHLGMTPEEATAACDGSVRYTHLPLVEEPAPSRQPLRFRTDGTPIATPGGPLEFPKPPAPDTGWRNVDDPNPPEGRYLSEMICNAKSGAARGHSEVSFTRPPKSLVTFVRHESRADEEKWTASAHEQALIGRYGPALSNVRRTDSLGRASRLLTWVLPESDACEPNSPDPGCWKQRLSVSLLPGDGTVHLRQSLLEPTSTQFEREKFERIGPR